MIDICLALSDRVAFIQHSCSFSNVKSELTVMGDVCFFHVYTKGFTKICNSSFQSRQFNPELKQELLLFFKQSYTDLLFFSARYSGKWIKNYQNAEAHQTYRFLWDIKARRSFLTWKLHCFLRSFLQESEGSYKVISKLLWKILYTSNALKLVWFSLQHHFMLY